MVKKRKRSENIFDMSFEIPSIDDISSGGLFGDDLFSSSSNKQKMDPKKMTKPELVRFLADNLSSEEIHHALISLGKYRLANSFYDEIKLINEEYEKRLKFINGDTQENDFSEKLINIINNEIVSNLRNIYTVSYKAYDEYDFHAQIEPFLKGMCSIIERSLLKLGVNINVYREYTFPSIDDKRNRIDLLIEVGNLKIGIEVKYELEKSGELQRLLGQIDTYIPYLDTLIVLSYMPLSTRAIKLIKSKEAEKRKPIKVITPEAIY